MASAAILCDVELGQTEVASIWRMVSLTITTSSLSPLLVSAIMSSEASGRQKPLQALIHAAKSLPSGTQFCLVALATMAMGDANAAQFTQCAPRLSGLEPAARARLLELPSPKDSRYLAGIIQDDHGPVEIESASHFISQGVPVAGASPAPDAVAPGRFATMGEAYRGARMVLNEPKSARREFEKTLWDAHIDGLRGAVGPLPDRVICLAVMAVLTAHVAKLGVATFKLLEVLSGAWVAAFIYLRRLMSLLDLVYEARTGRAAGDVLSLSSDLRLGLLSLTVVLHEHPF